MSLGSKGQMSDRLHETLNRYISTQWKILKISSERFKCWKGWQDFLNLFLAHANFRENYSFKQPLLQQSKSTKCPKHAYCHGGKKQVNKPFIFKSLKFNTALNIKLSFVLNWWNGTKKSLFHSLNDKTTDKTSAYSGCSVPAGPDWSIWRSAGFVPEILWPPECRWAPRGKHWEEWSTFLPGPQWWTPDTQKQEFILLLIHIFYTFTKQNLTFQCSFWVSLLQVHISERVWCIESVM